MPPDPSPDAPEPRPGALFHLHAGGLRDEVEVVSWRAREALSALYELEVNARVDPHLAEAVIASTLGEPATLSVEGALGLVRAFHGVVAEVRHDGRDETWHLRVVPRLWTATQRVGTRVFQDLPVDRVVDAVLARAGVEREWRLGRPLPPRPYCVQYQESDYDFVARLLAEAGIAYAFEHPAATPAPGAAAPRERLVLMDSVRGYRPLPAAPGEHREGGAAHPAVPFGRGRGMAEGAEALWRLDPRAALRPSVVSLRGYDSLRPSLDLRAANAARDGALAPHEDAMEVYAHEDAFGESDVSRASALTQLEQHRADARVDEGEGDCARMCPGLTFAADGHPLAAQGAPRVVVAVTHEGRAARYGRKGADGAPAERLYRNEVRCAPADVMVRPPRPRRAVVQTLETATVVGPPGQEVYVDPLGRVRVEFPWNREAPRDGSNTCWLRVSQAWAGAGFGAQFVPRVGTEVLVSFLGGDPDRPVVTGCLYSAEHRFPFELDAPHATSGVRTQSVPGGGGFNELSFHDEKHRELVLLRAERDLHLRARRAVELDAGTAHARVAGACGTVAGGPWSASAAELRLHSGGAYALDVGAVARVTTGSDLQHIVGGNFDASAIGDVSLDGANLHFGADREATLTSERLAVTTRGDASHGVAGSWTVAAGAAATVVAASSILLVCGSSGIEITDSGVRLWSAGSSVSVAAKSVKLDSKGKVSAVAPERVSLQGGDASAELADSISLSGSSLEAVAGDVSLRSSGASLDLDGEATLVGGAIHLNGGGGDSTSGSDDSDSQGQREPTVLRVKVRDAAGSALAGKRFALSLDGRAYPEGTTDGDGVAEVEVEPGARAGVLRVWAGGEGDPPTELPLRVAALEEASTVRGAKARLANLGYYHGPLDAREDAVFAAALARFQRDRGVDETGELDGATRDALAAAHP